MFNLLLFVLIFVIVVMISGGLWFYVNIFKKMKKEFTEFVQVTFKAFEDKKLTIAEREEILKEWSDIKPISKQIKEKFMEDVRNLSDEVIELYNNLKKDVKKKKK